MFASDDIICLSPRPADDTLYRQFTANGLQKDPVTCRAYARKRRQLRMEKLRIHRLGYAGVLHSGLPSTTWNRFDSTYVEFLKSSFKGRSYYGCPDYECVFCGAVFWYPERCIRDSTRRDVVYNNCCKGGRICLPPFKPRPQFLQTLLNFDGDARSKTFLRKIRQYNSIFAFTSMGANIDKDINSGGGPYVFKINGLVYHRVGSLLPREGTSPQFAQLYIYDTDHEVANRIASLNQTDGVDDDLDQDIVFGLMKMLDGNNPLVKEFRMARELLAAHGNKHIGLRIVGATRNDPVQFQAPTSNELAALIVGDFSLENYQRDIIVDSIPSGLQHVSCLHPAYMALQYPLLFPYGERGFQLGIPYRRLNSDHGKRVEVTMQDYFSYYFHYRKWQPNPYTCCGRLSFQSDVDVFACIEECRLTYIADHQDDFRCEHFQGITDAVGKGCIDGSSIGKKRVVPASFTGGQRYYTQHFQDAIAICRVYGPPDFFVTFTCNPKWAEIRETVALESGQRVTDRSDIGCRVYHMKYMELVDNIKSGTIFGPVTAVLQSIEFQKRGLPHAHILVWLASRPSEGSTFLVDKFISAEIPDPNDDPLGFALVEEFMVHGPCGKDNKNCPCMRDGKCSKHFPKDFQNETTIDDTGFILYRRRDTSQFVTKNGVKLDNRYVVPYNMFLLKKFQAHINVEYCNKSRVVKYLFKYVTKGPDKANVSILTGKKRKSTFSESFLVNKKLRPPRGFDPSVDRDEILQYIECRYIGDKEANWRVLGYELHSRMPSVERLAVHMPDMNLVAYPIRANLVSVISSTYHQRTTLTEWFATNKKNVESRDLTYCDFPTKWTWDVPGRVWKPRGNLFKIGRMFNVHPSQGETYYLRMLLTVVKGATCYEDLRTVGGIVYSTFKEACSARGMIGDDREWCYAFEEADKWASSLQLRLFFVMLVMYCNVTDEFVLFEKCWRAMADDIQYILEKKMGNHMSRVSDQQLRDMVIEELSILFAKNGASIDTYNLPRQTLTTHTGYANRIIEDENGYDISVLMEQAPKLYAQLNSCQRFAYDCITDSVLNGGQTFYFVSGFGGTGKTFLWNSIITFIRSLGYIVLSVASSGVASLLLPGGRTAHSRFKIPIDIDENTVCDIKRGTILADLIKKTSLIIWDEALMTHRRCFEALDRSLRDICAVKDKELSMKPFGGIVMVLGGDLRQILPVVEGGSRSKTVSAAITNSPLWTYVKTLHLDVNMRLSKSNIDPASQRELSEFSDWILSVGNGTVPSVRDTDGKSSISNKSDDDGYWIEIPDEFLIKTNGNRIKAMVDAVYEDFTNKFMEVSYLRDRAIVSPTNDVADEINTYMVGLVPGDDKEYLSCDTVSKCSDAVDDADLLYPIEFLNSIKVNNFPDYRLILKQGVPIMLLRNLNQAVGLCNGTRLIITQLADKVVEARVMTGSHAGDIVYLPRIVLSISSKKWPFTLQRRQFPFKVCYAMSINKSQGQTLAVVGLYLRAPVFSHGQLYVALSRVSSKEGLKILIENDDGGCGNVTKNVVYAEILKSCT